MTPRKDYSPEARRLITAIESFGGVAEKATVRDHAAALRLKQWSLHGWIKNGLPRDEDAIPRFALICGPLAAVVVAWIRSGVGEMPRPGDVGDPPTDPAPTGPGGAAPPIRAALDRSERPRITAMSELLARVREIKAAAGAEEMSPWVVRTLLEGLERDLGGNNDLSSMPETGRFQPLEPVAA